MSLLYTTTKHLHMTVVTLSVSLFTLRGLGVLAKQSWPQTNRVRRASMALDTLLLGLGLGLWWQLDLSLTQAPWLATKLALLGVYVVLGSLALKHAPSDRAKALCFALALATASHMAAVAVFKHPWGGFAHRMASTTSG